MTDTNDNGLLAELKALVQEAENSNSVIESEIIPTLEKLDTQADSLVTEMDTAIVQLDQAETETMDQIDAAVLEFVAEENQNEQ